MNKAKLTGVVLAVSAAAAFAFAPASAMAKEHNKNHSGKMVKCTGVNTCKGHSSCKTANNKCKGDNSCKGKGWVEMTKKQCWQVGGPEGGEVAKS